MAIQGSVSDSQTVTSLTETAFTVAFPQAGLTIVAVDQNATYVKVPIDSTRQGVLIHAGGNPGHSTSAPQVLGTYRRVHWTLNGQSLNYSTFVLGTTSVVTFYYGTPLQASKPLIQYAGVTAQATLSSGAGSATWSFPNGGIRLTGFSAAMGLAANSALLNLTWSTSSGQQMVGTVRGNIVTEVKDDTDIIPTDLPVSQTVTVAISSGSGSDVVVLFAFYQY